MTLHIAVIGIDGSGKSTLTATLPVVLAAKTGRLVAYAGETFGVIGPDNDIAGPRFGALTFSARLAMRLKRLAKTLVNTPKAYTAVKLAHMMCQDAAATALARKHGADIIVTDGNTLISAMGRAANYLRPAREGSTHKDPTTDDLAAAFAHIVKGTALPAASRQRLPDLGATKFIRAIHKPRIPDIVLFIDVPPAIAARRIASRGAGVDLHENIADLTQTRQRYLQTFRALKKYRKTMVITLLDGAKDQGSVLTQALAAVGARSTRARSREGALHTSSELSKNTFLSKVFNLRYLLFLLTHPQEGAWREPFFILSAPGRELLREGYSANVMRTIYDEVDTSVMGRVFLDYPLHVAVHDRLAILERTLSKELTRLLAKGDTVRIFTCPSGFAYDIFRPLAAIVRKNPSYAARIHLVAADLDIAGTLQHELIRKARSLGIGFTFIKGDLTLGSNKKKYAAHGPFDIALLVGISGWLPKKALLDHLTWLRGVVKRDGILISDCFTAAAYSTSGNYVGFKGSYYTSSVYATLLTAAGFNVRQVRDTPNDINHVLVAGRT